MVRSKDYLRLLAMSGAIGFVVALAAWCFLTVVPWIQNTVFLEIPTALGLIRLLGRGRFRCSRSRVSSLLW